MINFFGTNRVVPNGYIYTSHKGSEYIYFEGIWFNHQNMKMIDPNKAPQMHEAAKKQIIEHNCNNKQMIGESFKFTGKTYTYVGNNRYTEDGILTESSVLSEVIADDQRVYNVSRETLDKEWNDLHFFILPPHAEDITIPAGLVVNGYRFITNPSRFVSLKDGTVANNVLAKKLWAEGMRLVSSLGSEAGNDLIPINSTIMLRDQNKRGTWNGTDFRATDGSVVVDANKAQTVKQRYSEFVKQNPAEFPSLTGAKPEREIQDAGQVQKAQQKPFQPEVMPRVQEKRTPIREAFSSSDFSNFSPADPKKIEIPDKFKLGNYYYSKKNRKWFDRDGPIDNATDNKDMNTAAVKEIQKMNSTEDYPINSTVDFNGDTLVYNGLGWVSPEGKQYTSSNFLNSVQEYLDNGGYNDAKTSTAGKSESGSESGKTGYQVGQHVTVEGQPYIYRGGDVFEYPPTGEELPKDEARKIIKQYEEYLKTGKTQTTKFDKDGNILSTTDTVSQNTNPKAEPAPSNTDSASTVPDGYSLTSKAGVQYIRKNGQWISSQTKKPMNSSAAKSIDMAAERQIAEFNKSSPVKIGDKWKSGKGKEYTYVGGERFISQDGKLVPKSSASQILDKMKAEQTQSTEEVPQNSTDNSTGAVPPTPQAEPQDTTTPEPTNEPSAQNEPAPAGESNGLESLAQEIKAHPEARKITVLMTRGDKVSLLAADLILSGKQQDAIKILKALNSSDE